ncbi:MAG: rRNA maturation RNase YbeY [Colwellia sp.]
MSTLVDLQYACDDATNLPSAQQFQLWVDTALKTAYSKTTIPEKNIPFELTIRLVNSTESQQLNSQYRNKDKPTNVLSFPFDVPEGVALNLLGDLVICVPIIKAEANAQNKKLFDHWAHLVIHGCLHLLGFDHINDSDAKKMESYEIQLLASLDINNPYNEY